MHRSVAQSRGALVVALAPKGERGEIAYLPCLPIYIRNSDAARCAAYEDGVRSRSRSGDPYLSISIQKERLCWSSLQHKRSRFTEQTFSRMVPDGQLYEKIANSVFKICKLAAEMPPKSLIFEADFFSKMLSLERCRSVHIL